MSSKADWFMIGVIVGWFSGVMLFNILLSVLDK